MIAGRRRVQWQRGHARAVSRTSSLAVSPRSMEIAHGWVVAVASPGGAAGSGNGATRRAEQRTHRGDGIEQAREKGAGEASSSGLCMKMEVGEGEGEGGEEERKQQQQQHKNVGSEPHQNGIVLWWCGRRASEGPAGGHVTAAINRAQAAKSPRSDRDLCLRDGESEE
jgi:hypothetical protein